MSDIYVQYGCGTSAPAGWDNYDASPTLLIERIPLIVRIKGKRVFPKTVKFGDIVKGLPVSDKSSVGVYCSHVLEHLSLDDFRIALRNTFRILQPGGTFRLVVPDLEAIARAYVQSTSPDAALQFHKATALGRTTRPRGPLGHLRSLVGNSSHLWMWDEKSLTAELTQAGFTNIRRAQFGDDADTMFREVEDIGRWNGCLGMSAIRPRG